jgi:hypothetical protein
LNQSQESLHSHGKHWPIFSFIDLSKQIIEGKIRSPLSPPNHLDRCLYNLLYRAFAILLFIAFFYLAR